MAGGFLHFVPRSSASSEVPVSEQSNSRPSLLHGGTMAFDHRTIETFWQKYWEEHETFRAVRREGRPKYYVLDMFPYPSGSGLHVGHPVGYIATDIAARYRRNRGFDVLHPMG